MISLVAKGLDKVQNGQTVHWFPLRTEQKQVFNSELFVPLSTELLFFSAVDNLFDLTSTSSFGEAPSTEDNNFLFNGSFMASLPEFKSEKISSLSPSSLYTMVVPLILPKSIPLWPFTALSM